MRLADAIPNVRAECGRVFSMFANAIRNVRARLGGDFSMIADVNSNVRAPFGRDFSKLADAIRNVQAPFGRCFSTFVNAFRNVRAPFRGDFSRIADAIRNIRAPLGQCFLPSQMQFVAFGRRSGEISRRSPMRFCFPLTCLNHLVGERLPSSTEMRWSARAPSDVCFNTATRSVRAIGLQAPLPSGTQGCEYISLVERSSPRLP